MAEKQLKTADELKSIIMQEIRKNPNCGSIQAVEISRCPNNLRYVPIGALMCGPWWASRVLRHAHVTSNGIFRANLHSHKNRPQGYAK